MTVERYFTLTNSNTSLSKRFRVAINDFSRPFEKRGEVNTTVDAELDISRGGIYRTFNWTIMVRETEPDIDYGDIYDLQEFFSYNDPNGTPSDILTLTTHEGDTFLVVIPPSIFDPVPIGIMIQGEDAWFYPKVKFQVLSAVIPS